MSVKLLFSVSVDIEASESDELGEDLAVFLRESFFNGEDVIEVDYVGQFIEG